MKKIKPPILELERITEVKNPEVEIQENETVEERKIQNFEHENIVWCNIKFEKTLLNNVKITNSKLERNTFTDVIFRNCNFSNTSF